MNILAKIRFPVSLVALAVSTLTCSVFMSSSPADDQFLGKLAVILESDVADALELTDQQRSKLEAIHKAREAASVTLATSVRGLPTQESAEKLGAFRQQSEVEGLAVLTETQRAKLEEEIIPLHTTAPALPQPQRPANVDTSDSEPSDPQPSDPEPSDPEPSDPQPSDPEPSDPQPSDPEQPPVAVAEPSQQPIGQRPPLAARPEAKLRFNFSHQWADVLQWFAEQADLSLVMDAPPLGTFNYTDDREYTPDEAIDLLNSVLLTKGYTLVRRNRMLMLINLEDGIPPNLVTTVDLEDLDSRGEFELVSVLFQLDQWSPDEAEGEILKLIGPQGSVVALSKSRQIFVTETAGRLRSIRAIIERIETPGGAMAEQMQIFEMKYVLPEEVMDVIRQLLGIADDQNATSDGSLRFAMDMAGGRLLVSGRPGEMARVKEIIETVDVPGPGMADPDATNEAPLLRVYSVTTADPQSVLSVMQTLLAGVPDVRLDVDPKTGNLIAFARLLQHTMIAATLEEMQRDAQQIEVIRLYTVDPQLAVLSISKLFGASGEEPDPNAPRLDADPSTGQLFIRGTALQIEQIRSLLQKMGETETPEESFGTGGNVRMLPLEGRAARLALEQIQMIWPSLRRNRIRVVTPSSVISSIRPSSPVVPRQPVVPAPEPRSIPAPPTDFPEPPTELPPLLDTSHSPLPERSAATNRKARIFFAVQTVEIDDAVEADTTETAPVEPVVPDFAAADIIVAPGPGGVMIASADLEALDQFELLLNTMAGELLSGGPEITIFYLKYTKAATVAQTLDQILGGGTLTSSGGGGGGSLIGDLAGAAGGGILGALLGGGGGGSFISPSGTIVITPDTRLNALIVQAGDADIELIEQLLAKLDQKESPEEILVASRAEMIPVYNTQAGEIAEIVKEVYKDRMIGGSTGGGSGGRPNPEQIMQMLRGGRGQGGSSRGSAADVQKMSVSVDMRTNALVVAAPEQLFLEVKKLVEQLDFAAGQQSSEAVRTVTLHRVNAEVIQEALGALMGDSVQFGNAKKSPSSSTQRPGTPGGSPFGGSSDAARREMFMRMMQQRAAQPGGGPSRLGGGSPRPGGGPPGGGFRGGPPGGGFRGGPPSR